jgi:hypothetical protein
MDKLKMNVDQAAERAKDSKLNVAANGIEMSKELMAAGLKLLPSSEGGPVKITYNVQRDTLILTQIGKLGIEINNASTSLSIRVNERRTLGGKNLKTRNRIDHFTDVIHARKKVLGHT